MFPKLLFALTAAQDENPYGTYWVRPTDHGLQFQVSVRDPRNHTLLIALIGASLALALATYSGFWSFAGAFLLLLVLLPLPYFCFARIRLTWIEVRPDGLAITQNAARHDSCQFFDRRAISHRELGFDTGLTFRYGIHDVQATPAFADEREFEILEVQLEQAIARLWHQSNLNA